MRPTLPILAAVLAAGMVAAPAPAQVTIDPAHKYSWQENTGFMNWAGNPGAGQQVLVYPTYLTGEIWCENIGWVFVGSTPAPAVHYLNTDGTNYGVNVDASGNLYGYAWSENTGYLNFGGGALASPPNPARIDYLSHRFRGYAWSPNIGWVNLDDASTYVGLGCAAVQIQNQPQPVQACSGSSPTFHVDVTGDGPFVYQWRRGSSALSNSPPYSGVDTDTLHISSVSLAEAGMYNCVITNCSGVSTQTTDNVGLTIITTSPPGSADASPLQYCSGSLPAGTMITLTASGGSGTTLRWFDGGCGVHQIGTGNGLHIDPPTQTTTYSAAYDSGCGLSACASVTVTVNDSPMAPMAAHATPPSYCSASAPASIALTADGGSGDTLRWYSGAPPCGSTPVADPTMVPPPTVSTTYYARWESALCGNSSCASVTVSVTQSPDPPTGVSASPQGYCSGSPPMPLVLMASAPPGAGTITWYATNCAGAGNVPIGTGPSLSIMSPPSVTTVYWARVENGTCASTCVSTTVSVTNSTSVTASVDLSFVSAGAFDRCITFEFFTGASCPNPAQSQPVTMHFVAGHASTVFSIPCGPYTCITARDRLHTLRKTSDSAHLSVTGFDYTVSFTGPKSLPGGNLNDDGFIDILDFGGFISRFGIVYTDGNTPCGYTVPPNQRPTLHADFSGDHIVGTEDYSFITNQIFAARDPGCCGAPVADEHPITDISVWELAARGDRDSWEIARSADFNHDGRINQADIDFFATHGLPACPADFDDSGGTTVQDLFGFLTAWFSGHPAADMNDDQHVSVQDIFDFLRMWFGGC